VRIAGSYSIAPAVPRPPASPLAPAAIPEIVLGDLLPRYDALLLDAYGVLVDATGALPGAAALLAELRRRGQPLRVVTNDASRSAATCAARFVALGLAIEPHEVITSGSLLAPAIAAHGLVGRRVAVLGTDDSRAYVHDAGALVVPLAEGMEVDGVAICDDAGFPFLRGCELVVSACVRAAQVGRAPTLLLPNPDITYPRAAGEWGLTAGAIAAMIELALARRLGAAAPRAIPLGKPGPALLERACADLGTRRVLMVGDQPETDVAAALAAGVDVVLIGPPPPDDVPRATYRARDVRP
jgi:ribonucleotide monophosphatase NagD (HAD superfamily)